MEVEMLQIKKLKTFTMEDEKSFGLNGFDTSGIYEVIKEEKSDEIKISLKLKKLDNPMRKEWPHLESDIVMYSKIIKQGYSFGAYQNNKLVGVLIAENRKWNNSIWIAELAVSDKCRGNGIGSALMDKLFQIADINQIRLIGLETQNINLPAISFYRKKGFEIDGLDISLYSNDDILNNEIAIYMNKKM